ncbi:MAG: PD-(D/E)XK nuclease domain-containing protein [Deltaproteobacteria bacterium]|nr:PD-(D/E)XK nuclease domain-containing protein [Deltaproteobacteria bacterium]
MKNYIDLKITPIIEHETENFNIKTCKKFSEAFFKRQSDEAGSYLHSLFSCIPHSLHLPFEAFYHSLLFSIFRSADVDVEPEVDKAKGIIDLVIHSPDYGIMITEIKYAKSEVEINDNNKNNVKKITEKDRRQLDSSIMEAFKKILDQEYLSPYKGSDIPIYAVAIAVCGRSHVKIRSYPAGELLNNPSIYLADKNIGSSGDSPAKDISAKSSAPKRPRSQKPLP